MDDADGGGDGHHLVARRDPVHQLQLVKQVVGQVHVCDPLLRDAGQLRLLEVEYVVEGVVRGEHVRRWNREVVGVGEGDPPLLLLGAQLGAQFAKVVGSKKT